MDTQTFIIMTLSLLAIAFVVIVEVGALLCGIYKLYLIFDPRPKPYVHPNNMKFVSKDQ